MCQTSPGPYVTVNNFPRASKLKTGKRSRRAALAGRKVPSPFTLQRILYKRDNGTIMRSLEQQFPFICDDLAKRESFADRSTSPWQLVLTCCLLANFNVPERLSTAMASQKSFSYVTSYRFSAFFVPNRRISPTS